MEASTPYKLCDITSEVKSRGFRDYALQCISEMHHDFSKLQPVEPLPDDPPEFETVKPSLELAKPVLDNPSPQIKSCQYHVALKPESPCIDCFLLNYFGSDLSSSAECADSARIQK